MPEVRLFLGIMALIGLGAVVIANPATTGLLLPAFFAAGYFAGDAASETGNRSR